MSSNYINDDKTYDKKHADRKYSIGFVIYTRQKIKTSHHFTNKTSPEKSFAKYQWYNNSLVL